MTDILTVSMSDFMELTDSEIETLIDFYEKVLDYQSDQEML